MRALLLCLLPLLSSCGTSRHMTDSLTCFGFCAHVRVEHDQTPAPSQAQPTKEKEQ